MDTLYDYELFKAIKEAFYTVFKIDIPEKVIAFVFLSIVALGIIITIYKYIISRKGK